MYEIKIAFPFLEEKTYYYKSLSAASRDLDLTEYFLRNAYYKKHRNQFAQYFHITKCTRRELRKLRKHYHLL